MTEPDFLRSTRASYDAVAPDYSGHFRDELAAKPLDRAMLAGFAEFVRTAGAGPVADIGCGTGRVTGHLSGLGLSVFGVDLSPQMVAVARRSFLLARKPAALTTGTRGNPAIDRSRHRFLACRR